ncbi:hypothetical protein EIN_282010 [Entamoeba invadens IP1]|uniref:Uncharacterized protein n=1 Tax=Entamoeba invadens IP1 TaxID=370355 RepID=A0A0A1TX12_ENTIV|nr:hypothetical protein EIN_282010 [Entamoeba invadens IP1]ELP85830.1 hypothetical protein EIN_282010 [Entamoeba invadens IP1]|eukprot:XP_004185176.1 hypothetical protein EIN_282010 [Entamoeba invadens IP1]
MSESVSQPQKVASVAQVEDDNFEFLIDGSTMSSSYLMRGCKHPHKVYFHHYCKENIPIVKSPLKENGVSLYDTYLTDNTEALGQFQTRGIILLKLNSIARGNSIIQPQTIELLIKLYECDILPLTPKHTQNTISGNTYHIAAIGKALYGAGDVMYKGEKMSCAEAMTKEGLKPVVLEEMEFDTFLNGNEKNVMDVCRYSDILYNTFEALAINLVIVCKREGFLVGDLAPLKNFSTKGPTKIGYLFRDALTVKAKKHQKDADKKCDKEVQKSDKMEEKRAEGDKEEKNVTNPTIFDMICSLGKIYDVFNMDKELIKNEINMMRVGTYATKTREGSNTFPMKWGIGNYCDVVRRQLIGISKDLVLFCKSYGGYVKFGTLAVEEEKTSEEKSPYYKLKMTVEKSLKCVARFADLNLGIAISENDNMRLNSVFENLKNIGAEKLEYSIRFGDFRKTLKEQHLTL